MTDRLTYLLCATPRSGSTLLCSLLRSSGVAGRPESYLREPDEADWAARWHVPTGDYAAFVRAAVAAGSTPNGVAGIRVMWDTMGYVVDRLEPSRAAGADDRSVLEQAVGTPLRFLYLHRNDTLGQAVSWARSEQTGYWHPGDATGPRPQFDVEQIHRLVRTIAEHNAAWRRWFDRLGIEPYEITYELLSDDRVGTARAILGHLGLDAADEIRSDDRRQADDLNAEWVARYRALA